MRSISEILNLVVDGVVTTKAQATAILEEEVTARMNIAGLKAKEARRNLLEAIGFSTTFLSHEHGDKVMQLFDTEHPVWGRTHPTPEQALRLAEADAAVKRQQKEKN
jgi:hypothetical protein